MRQPAQERGRRRRDTLLDAAVELLGEGGFDAVSHRAVADRARLPLAATTYYFRSRDDLIAAAFELMVDRDLAVTRERFTARIRRLGAAAGDRPAPAGGAAAPRMSARAAAEALAAALLPRDETERLRHLALWELYLRAGRDPALRPLARAWTDRCRATTAELLRIAGYPAGPAAVTLLGAAADGLTIEAVVEARPNAVQSMVEIMSHALDRIRMTEGA
ncbi:MAG TPA: TetR family transcriptional regulator [Streptosporangiaceae bacterium]|nr:TetR family transcriptional regulator [Streptosporangiaceae bacterium]